MFLNSPSALVILYIRLETRKGGVIFSLPQFILAASGEVFLRRKNKVIGYVLGVLPESELEILKEWDPDFFPKEGDLYVESVAVLPEMQNKGAISYLYDKLMEKAKELGFKRMLRHGRRSTSSPIIKYKYKVEPKRTIENWQGWGEPFDYFEIPIG